MKLTAAVFNAILSSDSHPLLVYCCTGHTFKPGQPQPCLMFGHVILVRGATTKIRRVNGTVYTEFSPIEFYRLGWTYQGFLDRRTTILTKKTRMLRESMRCTPWQIRGQRYALDHFAAPVQKVPAEKLRALQNNIPYALFTSITGTTFHNLIQTNIVEAFSSIFWARWKEFRR